VRYDAVVSGPHLSEGIVCAICTCRALHYAHIPLLPSPRSHQPTDCPGQLPVHLAGRLLVFRRGRNTSRPLDCPSCPLPPHHRTGSLPTREDHHSTRDPIAYALPLHRVASCLGRHTTVRHSSSSPSDIDQTCLFSLFPRHLSLKPADNVAWGVNILALSILACPSSSCVPC